MPGQERLEKPAIRRAGPLAQGAVCPPSSRWGSRLSPSARRQGALSPTLLPGIHAGFATRDEYAVLLTGSGLAVKRARSPREGGGIGRRTSLRCVGASEDGP